MAKDIDAKLSELTAKYSRNLNSDGSEKYIKSGSIILDTIISNGKGIPLNKFIQISSESGLGKSTLILHVCKFAILQGYKVAYLDIEGGVNESQLEGLGLSEYLGDSFFLFTASTFEDAEEILDVVLQIPDLAYIVVDSVTALLPGKLIDKSIAEIEPGLHARYAGAFLSKYRAKLNRSVSKPTVFFTNQMRNKLNFRGMTTYAAAGGSAQKFYADIRILMRDSKKLQKTIETIEGKDNVQYGYENFIWSDKNRYNSPFVQAIIDIIFGKGVSDALAYLRILMQRGVCSMGGGGWYNIQLPGNEDVWKAQGQDGIQKLIVEHIDEISSYIESTGGISLIQIGDQDEQ